VTFAIPALGHNEHDVLPLIVAVALGAMAATILTGLARHHLVGACGTAGGLPPRRGSRGMSPIRIISAVLVDSLRYHSTDCR
jgi:hypothetical protein